MTVQPLEPQDHVLHSYLAVGSCAEGRTSERCLQEDEGCTTGGAGRAESIGQQKHTYQVVLGVNVYTCP